MLIFFLSNFLSSLGMFIIKDISLPVFFGNFHNTRGTNKSYDTLDLSKRRMFRCVIRFYRTSAADSNHFQACSSPATSKAPSRISSYLQVSMLCWTSIINIRTCQRNHFEQFGVLHEWKVQ
jgi:hypothetical protein